jgi:1,2-diacylglycerol 3-alpha-glucosyltransferase
MSGSTPRTQTAGWSVEYPAADPNAVNSSSADLAYAARAIRTAVVFINYGPYHVARARALAAHPQIEPYFIELASMESQHPWLAEKAELRGRLITLCEGTYERRLERKIVAVLRQLRPAALAVAGYSEPAVWWAASWARRNRCGVVMFSDTTSWDRQRRWWLESLKRLWIQRYVDAAMVGGQPQRAYLRDLGMDEDRIWDGYNVVDNEFFASQAEVLRADKAAACDRDQAGLPHRYFLFVGRFAPEKNLRDLLHAYARYRFANKDGWGLVIVGDGPQREELLQIVRSLKLNDVVFPGFKQLNELPQYYAFASCLILPSSMEPWGLVVNEAMASGLPVLASNRCGCISDLISPEDNGFTFSPNDVEEMARCMSKMAGLSTERLTAMGGASRKIISRWTPEIWADQLASAVRCATQNMTAGTSARDNHHR